jgi:tetrahydromethanopterin S-methyltransferase subunit H
MKFLIILGLVLSGFVFVGFFNEDLAFAQSNQNTIKVSFENNVASSYEVPISGKQFSLIQSYSWVQDETSRYSLVSYTLDGETVNVSRAARGDFTLSIPTDSSHTVMFSAVLQYALSVEGTNNFSYLPSSPN